ncbi:2-succinyl-5-enolpyruvyl-6-hydroxy-3-cyclohexene-1-carboxylic-acid synthase [Alkalihalobacillus sp. AL-G]|uniref:2-succinyl-5-enolpyruvyl-6-hydroxy-3- cyclohexene-1-carboxylic-acid synthase n=1 Tax=Alkalihalobacillus sp. AL-G TaxID=2926399 RepID=UPI00272D0D82|nr:2-succinyl-5-enolpyruvyl-6-hydroxy-3-cyclohexene-1-carboxylic-acid synthase [Alkalihalobacillus sp. AL-G]WLD92478.1 2-succinyl-5-enolpyruvyl-6-hydroxy-3-cyclohexene-1-carboxylic-acid synthase [Alkalihalobacillus sp. AL-G]
MTLDALTAYVGAFVDEISNTVKDVVISPGSRSTPLALLFAQHPDVRVWLNVDERSAAFFALGIAKAKQQPVALVCTSGTAAANYYPAVIEAYESRVPLLVLTADRPHELRDVSAPQAIDQLHLYGKYVKWFHEMAIPDNSDDVLHYVRSTAARSSATTLSGKKGPVHLNFPLREPLVPDYQNDEAFCAGKSKDTPFVQLATGRRDLEDNEYSRFGEQLSDANRGLIVCGPGDYKHASQSISDLAEALHFPILADPLSPMRYGTHSKDHVIENYDALLKSEIIQKWNPELIIRFGAMPVSKPYLQFIKKHEECAHLIIDEGDGWREPTHLGGSLIYVDPDRFARRLLDSIRSDKRDANWFEDWKNANTIVLEVKHQYTEATENRFEGKIFSQLEKTLPEHTNLFVGNSMPIRDLDSFFGKTRCNIRTFANRGANGIDGVVSSALGIAATGERTVLVIGDLSFYHDMNGLLAAKLHDLDLTIILVNNSGGGIFSFLPQSKHSDHFEHLFGTPIGIPFEKAASMYDGEYVLAENWNEFDKACERSLSEKGLHVIELQTDRKQNVELHRSYWENVHHALLEWQEKRK